MAPEDVILWCAIEEELSSYVVVVSAPYVHGFGYLPNLRRIGFLGIPPFLFVIEYIQSIKVKILFKSLN